jgi:hypothetical protein
VGNWISIAVASDGSGTIDECCEGELVMQLAWASGGTGAWWMYSDGIEVDSGSWAK